MHNQATRHPPLISDAMLRAMAAPDYAASTGEFDAETRASLAIALPEMARELLGYRAHGAKVVTLAIPHAAPDAAAAQSLSRARAVVSSAHPVACTKLTAACRTIMALSTDPIERTAAAEVLADLGEAA